MILGPDPQSNAFLVQQSLSYDMITFFFNCLYLFCLFFYFLKIYLFYQRIVAL